MKFSNKFFGGPAKAAVISSGLMDMVFRFCGCQRSDHGQYDHPNNEKNRLQTGGSGRNRDCRFHWRSDYASPIMGVGAFIMAETLSMNNLQIAADAIIPALAYYFSVFVLVSFLAKKRAAANTQRLRFAIRLILTALIEIGLSE